MAMAIIMFSFGGIELVGIAAAETKNPTTTIPKAVKSNCLSCVAVLRAYDHRSALVVSMESNRRRR